ncbi:MAG: type VI-B CRISPR accessory protein Csx27, partial [Porphyromonas gingivalis]
MEKFSLYDFLAIILPGIAFIVVFRIIFSSLHLSLPVDIPLGLESTIVYALICGAVLYVLSFSLVKLFPRLFGLYRHVADLYQKMKALHPIMNDTLNR